MNSISYNCKVCRKPGFANYDPDCPIKDIEAWRSMLTCNRCGDFRLSFVPAKEAVVKLCTHLARARMVQDGEELKQLHGVVRTRLETATKRLCTITCSHYRTMNQWDVEFVNVLMDNPAKAISSVDFYHRSIRKQAVAR